MQSFESQQLSIYHLHDSSIMALYYENRLYTIPLKVKQQVLLGLFGLAPP